MRRLIIPALALIVLAAVPLLAGRVHAYEEPPAHFTASEDPAQQRRGEAELPWLFAVYTVTWAAFFGYVFIMSRRQREMQREIEALKRALDAKMDTQDN